MPPVMMEDMLAACGLEASLRRERPAIVAYLVGGYPDRAAFRRHLVAVSEVADAVEIGVPFTDPMADGATIQEASRVALAGGTSLRTILEDVTELRGQLHAPILLMGYLNPFLAHGITTLARDAAAAGVAGFIIPDLPLEHAGDIRESLAVRGIALVNLVTPISTEERTARLARSSRGFLYAVTRTGITGGETSMPAETTAYLAALSAQSRVPVIAGFGIRTAAQVQALAPHVDGVVVGTALLDAIGRGEDPAAFLAGLRG